MFPFIVADIGGTNARFALVTGHCETGYVLEQQKILPADQFASLEAAAQTYIAQLDTRPQGACVAIAGPVHGDKVEMTNLNWHFSVSELERSLDLERLIVINDFAAQAMAALELGDEDFTQIKSGTQQTWANKAIFGPGTGLGVAALVADQQRWLPIASEGGHMAIQAADAFEAEVIKAAYSEVDYLSCESFLSGPGLLNLYRAIAHVEGCELADVSPADITRAAQEGSDTLSVKVLDTFCAMLGSFAGNLALVYGAKGGVYIGGGVVPRFSAFLLASEFETRFKSRGLMSHYLDPIPVYLMSAENPAFVGAARYFMQASSHVQ